MKHSSSARRLSVAAMTFVVGVVLVGCGSPVTNQPLVTGTPRITIARATATAGLPTGDGLCAVFTPELAVAALGAPVDAPTGGDVVPRPNGVYCHYALAGNANFNVEAQLKDMTREQFDALAVTFGMTEALPGVGQAAFKLDRSILGGAGVAVLAWSNGRGVTVTINNEGDQPEMLAAAGAIAAKVLALA